jgi:hypothetical protein
MARQLPDKANLENLKKQAKALLKAQQRHEAGACELLSLLPRFSKASPVQMLAAVLSLHECQYALALSYGFRSWPALRTFLLNQTHTDQEENTMSIVNPDSLSVTLDTFNELVFAGQHILANASATECAHWIISRAGRPRSYHNLPAPTPLDFQQGARLFTGERVISRVGIAHILGEEACRALVLLGIKDRPVQEALAAAMKDIATFGDPRSRGFFCCATCSMALWRSLSVLPLPDAEERLADGVRGLAARRDGTGKWGSFPFYYTLLALTGLPDELARPELRYAAPVCERLVERPLPADHYGLRRRKLLERVLEKC